jgi:hypothetical protein
LRELLSAIFNFKYGVVSQLIETFPLISFNTATFLQLSCRKRITAR